MSYYECLFPTLAAMAGWAGPDDPDVLPARARPRGGSQFVRRRSSGVGCLLNPAALLVVIFGVLLVIEVDGYEFSQFWISAALAMFLASAITAPGVLGQEGGSASSWTSAAPPTPRSSAGSRESSGSRGSSCPPGVLIVLDMVVKPGL